MTTLTRDNLLRAGYTEWSHGLPGTYWKSLFPNHAHPCLHRIEIRFDTSWVPCPQICLINNLSAFLIVLDTVEEVEQLYNLLLKEDK